MTLKYRVSYYPWITQNVDSKEIFNNISILILKTEEQLKQIIGGDAKIELLQPLDVPKQIELITKGNCEIALMNPLGFVFANQTNQNVSALSVVERKIDGNWGTTYFSQVYTSKKSAINRGDLYTKLKGKSIGFGVPFSTSNFIIPAYELKQKGINFISTFNRIEFYGGHELVAKAVYDGRVDVGAGHDGAIIDLSNQNGFGDADEKLVTLLRSSPIPSDPIAVNISSADERRNLQLAFKNASMTSEGEQAISRFWGGARHLLEADTNKYSYLLTAVKELGLTQKDLIG